MTKRIRRTYVFGTDAVKMYHRGTSVRAIKKAIKDDCLIGEVKVKIFSSPAAYKAYEQALLDLDGWKMFEIADKDIFSI